MKIPKKLKKIANTHERQIILKKLFVNFFAIVGGMVKRQITKIIPMMLIKITIAIDIKLNNRKYKYLTLKPCK